MTLENGTGYMSTLTYYDVSVQYYLYGYFICFILHKLQHEKMLISLILYVLHNYDFVINDYEVRIGSFF